MIRKFDGMSLESPLTLYVFGVYRSGELIAIFRRKTEAKKHMNASCSLRQVEDYRYQMRVVPLVINLELQVLTEGS